MRSSTSENPGVNIDSAPLCGGNVSEAGGASGMDRLDADVRRLLVPVKNAKEMSYGIRYARNLLDRGVSVKVCLLHVTDAAPRGGLASRQSGGDFSAANDVHVQSFIAEATTLLNESRIKHDCHIRRGDVVFMIFDSAERFDCHEIVLPESRPQFLSRIFSDSTTQKLIRSRRSVPVIMVNALGLVCASTGNEFGHTRIDPLDQSSLAARRSI